MRTRLWTRLTWIVVLCAAVLLAIPFAIAADAVDDGIVAVPAGAKTLIEWVVVLAECGGILAIIVGGLGATYVYLRDLFRDQDGAHRYRRYRQRLGQAILLGLEILVAADIIHTVAIDLSFTSVGILALIVLIRTFLSFTLTLEIEGRWPWQQAAPAGPDDAP